MSALYLKRRLLLVLLGVWNAEVVSMGTFFYEFAHPSNIFVTFMYYALHFLIIEDLYSRFKLTYRDLLLIGIIFGLLEEGVLTLTFYMPVTEWLKAGYGRFFGINTVWATFLTFFHAVYTITLTFMIVDRFFPRSFTPFLNKKTYVPVIAYLLVLYSGNPLHVVSVVLPSQLHFNFKPRLEALLIVASLIVILTLITVRRVRRTLNFKDEAAAHPSPPSRRLLVSDATIVLLMSALWWIPYMYSYEGFPELLALVYVLALATLFPSAFTWYVKRKGGLSEKRIMVVTASIISFYVSLSAYCYFLSHDYISVVVVLITLILELEIALKRPVLINFLSLVGRKAASVVKKEARPLEESQD
ncbi:MAG: hypothetical protein QW461_07575 [Candidatus Jordarchaeales archaeon]